MFNRDGDLMLHETLLFLFLVLLRLLALEVEKK